MADHPPHDHDGLRASLADLERKAELGGGPERIEKQHAE